MRRFAFVLALLLVVAACRDDDGGATTVPATGDTVPVGPLSENAALDMMRDDCADGDFLMCDLLYQASPFDSIYEAFGDTCGERNDAAEFCAELYGETIDLGDFRDRCGAGDMVGCDLLYIYSPFGSADEAFGDSCGGLGDPGQSCVLEYGFRTG